MSTEKNFSPNGNEYLEEKIAEAIENGTRTATVSGRVGDRQFRDVRVESTHGAQMIKDDRISKE